MTPANGSGAGNAGLADFIEAHGSYADLAARRDGEFIKLAQDYGRWRDGAEHLAHELGASREQVFRALDAASTLARHGEPEEAVRRFRELLDARGATAVVLRELGNIVPEAIDWLCQGWFARGHVHLLAGPPGLGKSTIAGDITARVSTGRQWADGTPMHRGRVVVWSGEESVSQTLAPRLFASGADPRMVSVVGEVTDAGECVDFSPAQHLPLLVAKIAALSDVALLIIDPVLRIIEGAKDSYNPSVVREKLAPVVALAAEHRVAVLGVTHFSKLQSAPASGRADRVLGSGAWVQVARVVYGIDHMDDDDDEGHRKRALMPLKNNLAPLGDGLSFRTREVVLPDRDITGVRVEWTGTVEGDADEVLAQPRPRGKRQPGDDALASAGTWLCVTLEEHPTGMKWRELTARGQSAGHSEATLRRARDVLRKDGTLEKAKSHQWRLTIDELAQGSPETCSNPASLI